MRPLTYFAFTLLSVVIQFCVMDFIQEKLEVDENPTAYNETIDKQFMGILEDQTNLALYYRSRNDGYEKIRELPEIRYPNSTHNVTITTTEVAFTVFDVIYDENFTTTDGSYTTDSFITTTELDNVTEITLFEKSSTTARPVAGTKKIKAGGVCYCNLLYKQCDINCCCDEDCSLADKQLFDKCKNFSQKKRHPLACGESSTRVGFGNLLCIAKTNLPEQRAVLNKQVNEIIINDVFLWQNGNKQAENCRFNRDIYKAGAPVWILRNKSIYHLELPASIVNNYCGVRRKMTFLRNEKINCLVKLKDLEIFRVLKMAEDSSVVSATNNSTNNTVMNCFSLYCTNWTIIYCDQLICAAYNKSSHAPTCTESDCTNVALKIEYVFYVYESKIVNATIKLHAQKITPTEYVTQDIDVKFYIGISSERVVTLSGNPGYVTGSPLIASYTEANHTENFFNSSIEDNYISHADNKGGLCVLTRFIKKDIEFGINKRTNCRIMLRHTAATNATEACVSIQRNIYKMAAVDRKVHLSPHGNPDNVKDDAWLPVELVSEVIYGEYQFERSKLQCFNIRTRVAFVFVYADLSDTIDKEENKLLNIRVDGSASNVTFEAGVYTTVVTIDINFINMRAAARRELAPPPHLHLNLPNNFFFPFPSNASCSTRGWNIFLIFYSFVAKLFVLK